MSSTKNVLKALRIRELGGRDATVLQSGSIRVMIDDIGGMIPELSYISEKSRINAHWLPWFRSNSGKPFGAEEEGFWKANLLYHIAGNFPCAPNFGGDTDCDGLVLPPHGWAANLPWHFCGTDSDDQAVWAVSALESPEPKMPLAFKKIDALVAGHPVHYASLEIANKGSSDIEICVAWHNTVGAPFLQCGCKISGAAKRWITADKGSEFEHTTRLAFGAEFASLERAPLAFIGTEDISIVPEQIGYTDFACGVIPAETHLGWSAVVNPSMKMAYVCFFTGAAAAAEDDIILRFNDLWMQYGGRLFTPWAPCEGGTDLTYCLGAENSAAGYAYGLQFARTKKELLGAPTTVTIPAGKSRTLRYGTLFTPYMKNVLDTGVTAANPDKDSIIIGAKNGWTAIKADPAFTILKEIEKRGKA